jgi:CheY-like chemotaxis protein
MVSVKGRVLIVDDDLALAEMLGIVLRGEGFEPVFCSDGLKAVGPGSPGPDASGARWHRCLPSYPR